MSGARALILDRDPLTRHRLRRSLAPARGVEIIGEVSCAEEAMALLDRLGANVLITAEQSGTPAAPRHEPEAETVRIPVQRQGRTVLVDASRIVFADAAGGYARLKLGDERHLVSFSLSELERRLPDHFFRAHRSCLVNLHLVRELTPDFGGSLTLIMGDRERSRVGVSRRRARDLRARLGVPATRTASPE
ncbi:LytTR family DNA-binding domain-containing protein [Nesterenkonia sp. NBAIMH1]|uniref:LytR/AlgR family response regulator transcription factor n=1 Tax=Nesterenkonia sp. NBAIMH1 TaxID=2600320 RepID=UPI0011B798B3|nr:response regulator transcription factor [Nesterenkonia sp. NBAIMH1]